MMALSPLPTPPTVRWAAVPKMSCAQSRQLTVLATGRYGHDILTLMDTAGQRTAEFTTLLAPDGPILIVAGRGNNGAVGLAAACHLASMGRRVWVVPTHEPENYSGVPKEQLEKLAALEGVRVRSSLPKMKFGCVIDAAVGTRLEGPPRGRTLDVITVVNNLGCPVIALDVPTGLSADDGHIPGDVIHASATLAFILPKPGTPPGGDVGDLYVASLGLPPEAFTEVGLEPFGDSEPWSRIVQD
jgi:hydroxyethylthiazole kinase-like uncharacterized protein yjeF